jgi:RND superfamily putative drug exporter
VLERWTRAVLRHRVAVVTAWLVVLLLGGLAAARLSPLLSTSFAVPGTDSDRARSLLADHFGERPDGGFTVVFEVRHPSDRALQETLRRRVARAAAVIPTAHVGLVGTGGGIVFVEVGTTLDLQHAKRHTDALRERLRAAGGPAALVTGQPAIQHDVDPILAADLRRGELIAVPAAVLVLLAVFGLSLAVAIPFLVAACTIAATLGAVYVLAHAVPMVTYVTNLVALIGLGLAIDYALLIVHRFREELAGSGDVEDAVVRAAATAGRAVVASGLAVAAGLALLLFIPVPLLRSMGVGGLLIPLASVLAALTLQPALLSLLGRRAAGTRGPGSRGFWERLARSIMRRPRSFLAAGAVLLLLAAAPAVRLEVTPGSFSSLPQEPEAMRGYVLLRDSVGRGAITPTHVVVDSGAPGGARRGPTSAAVQRLVDELGRDPEVLVVATGRQRRFVDPTGRYARVIVGGRHEYGDEESRDFVERLRDELVPRAGLPAGASAYAGGAPAQGVDFLARSYGSFPWLVLGVVALTFLLLLRAFRSLVLPLKALVLNALSVGAVYGILALLWGEVEGWIPVFLFAVLFGLSMDYEVFLVSRMRETWDLGAGNRDAVARGLERTGHIVTAAALIMVVALSGLAAGEIEPLRQFGVALALAVLIDATLVRAVLVPALMAVLGRWNWWLPGASRKE